MCMHPAVPFPPLTRNAAQDEPPCCAFGPGCRLRQYDALQLLALLSVHRLPVALLAPLVAVGPLEARLALQPRTWFLAVRADLEADVALDLILTLGRGFGGGGGRALIVPSLPAPFTHVRSTTWS